MPGYARTQQNAPILIALVYAISGSLWIYSSDRIWSRLTQFPFAELVRLQTVKGLVFVGLTSLPVWYMVRRSMQQVARAEPARGASEARYRQVRG